MSDEEERWRKTKRENNHSGMKGAAAVSLCCTKQSQASSSLSIYLAGKKNRGVEEEERRRGREKCWKREWSLLLFKKKKKKVLTHTGQSPARWQTKKRQRTGKFSLCQRLQRLWCNNNQNPRRTGTWRKSNPLSFHVKKSPAQLNRYYPHAHSPVCGAVHRYFQIFLEANAIRLQLNQTTLCAGTVTVSGWNVARLLRSASSIQGLS